MTEFNIDPNFSVYALVHRSQSNTSVLNHRRTMSVISHELENATIIDHADNVVFASFQKMSRFLPQIKRYRMLARHAQHVYVFGIMDTVLPQIDNITYVPLQEHHRLSKEWFLVSFGEAYFSALATEELSNIDDPDDERLFRGIWSFDVEIVELLHDWLSRVVGLRREQMQVIDHDFENQVRLMTNTVGRLNVRIMDADENANRMIQDELSRIMGKGLYGALKHLQNIPKPIQQNYVPRVATSA